MKKHFGNLSVDEPVCAIGCDGFVGIGEAEQNLQRGRIVPIFVSVGLEELRFRSLLRRIILR